MIYNGYNPDAYLMTKILMLYARSGCLDDLCYARELFEEMPERNLTAWNTMILAYARADNYVEVLRLYARMRVSGNFSDKFTFPSVIKACTAMEDIDGIRQLQSSVVKAGLASNLIVGGALVDGYARFSRMDDAVTALDEIEGTSVITWNAVIAGYIKVLNWEEAWEIFDRMIKIGVYPDNFTFASALRVCGGLRSRDRGKQVHSKLIACGFKGDTFVGNSLIDMYAKCGDEESCLKVFNEMGERNQVTWNTIISAEAQFGHFHDALVLFLRMQESGCKSNRFNLGSILMASAGLADIGKGRELHGHLIRNLLDSDIILGSALVDLYSKCGMVEEGHQVFKTLLERNEVSYNALLAGYVQEGKAEKALELYHDMQSEDDIQPDHFTFSTLLTLCADQGNDYQGRQIHARLIKKNITKNIIVETELVHMYAECGRLNYAKEIFNQMAERNAYAWNSMIEGYEQNGRTEEAVLLFKQMQINGIKPDCFSLASMISSCVSLSDWHKGKELHNFIVRNSMEEEGILRVLLVNMYAKCGSMDYAWNIYDQTIKKDVILNNVMISAFVNSGRMNDAKNVFDQMEQRNLASWNAVLACYAKEGLKRGSFNHFLEMLENEIEFDVLTMVTLVNLCSSLPALEHGEQLHSLIIKKGFVNCSVVLETALVDMYAKCGVIKKAREVFDNMNEKNIISWNAMINGYSKHGCSKEALILFKEMEKEGMSPNEVTFLSILSACSHTGLVEEGWRIFSSMQEKYNTEPKAEHYTCIVDLLGRAGRLEDAKEFVEKMPMEPDVSTWGALLGACRVHKDMDMGRLAAERLFELDPQNPGPYVIMSNIYAAAGRWKEVEDIRQMMKMKGVTKEPGVSWIEINSEIQIFHAGSKTHPRTEEICNNLRQLTSQSKGLGYIPDTDFILQNVKDVKEEEEEEYLLQHSERLALSLGIISLPEKSTIRVFKNLRICGDCHNATKFISEITGRRIIVRDTKRFHHFEGGKCSCGDYW